MHHFRYSLFLVLLLIISCLSHALEGKNHHYGFIPNTTYSLLNIPNIRTISIHQKDKPGSLPVVDLKSGEPLLLSFDDLFDKVEPYHYRIKHLNPDGSVSDLYLYEYQTGFEINPINNYQFSINTHQTFIHYQLEIPNNDVQLLVSGKYSIEVFESSMAESPVFNRIFYVSEQTATADLFVRPSTLADQVRSHQELELQIKTHEVLPDPFRRVQINLVQNTNPLRELLSIQPRYINGRDFVFNTNQLLQFDGGNEFRFFNTKDHRFKSAGIFEISFLDGLYQFYLEPAASRQFKRYESYLDFDGRFRVDNAYARDIELESDYVMVHFSLMADAPFIQESLYIFGELSGWALTDDYKMDYNYRTKRYEQSLLLKQGYYNYTYVLKNDSTGEVDLTRLEGNHSETVNNYQLYLYYLDQARYYRLLLVESFPGANSSEFYRE